MADRDSADASECAGAAFSSRQVLTALAALGLSNAARDGVMGALQKLELQQQQAGAAEARVACSRLGHEGGGQAQEQSQALAALEAKCQMSRNIMRKLYTRNLELEKELQVTCGSARIRSAFPEGSYQAVYVMKNAGLLCRCVVRWLRQLHKLKLMGRFL
jgi:microsomal dipeptidase-like Zn-dependent dipeptidase